MGTWTFKSRVVLLATALAVVGLAVLPVAAHAITGPIAGTVTAEGSGDPLYGIGVNLHKFDSVGGTWDRNDFVQTDSDGKYEFPFKVGGDYKVGFNLDLLTPEYDAVYYSDASTLDGATVVRPLAMGVATADQALTYREPDVIGYIKNPNGDPLANAAIKVYDDTLQEVTTAFTDDTGAFGVRRLDNNEDYYFYFVPSDVDLPFYLPEYWEDAATLAQATTVVYDPMMWPMDMGVITLEPKSPQVMGIVYKDGSNTRVPDIEVQAWQYDTAAGTWSEFVPARALTDWEGHFTMYGLSDSTPDNRWYLRAYDPTGHFAPRFFNGQLTAASANEVPITNGEAPGSINFQLPDLAPSVSGNVKEAGTNRPIRDCEVLAYTYDTDLGEWSEEYTASGWTDSNGDYKIYGLYDDQARIVFNEWSGSKLAYSDIWYNGKTTPGAANAVTMTTGTTKMGINGVLTRRPVSIKGRLSGDVQPGSRLEPISIYTIEVDLEQWDPAVKAWDSAAGAYLDQNGDYAFYGLANGTYRVSVKDPGGYYYSQFYNGVKYGAKVPASGTNIAYTVGSGTRVANFSMERAAWGLTGTVRDTSSNPLEGMSVDVLTFDPEFLEWQSVDTASTSATGTYALPGPVRDGPVDISQANVKIQFSDSTNKYLQQWANGKASVDDADLVPVTFDKTATQVNATLQKGTPAFGGTVSADGGGAASGVQIAVYPDLGNDSWPEYLTTTMSNQSGVWEIYLAPDAVPSPHGYVFSFTSWDGKFADEVYSNKALTDPVLPANEMSAGDRVFWAGSGSTAVVNASLAQQNLSMSGTVTNNNGGGFVSGMGVYAFSSVPSENNLDGPYNRFAAYAVTDEAGEYAFYGLDNGKNYKIQFADEEGSGVGTSYLPQWFDGVNIFDWFDPALVDASVGAVANSSTPRTDVDGALILGEAVEPTVSSDIAATYGGPNAFTVAEYTMKAVDPEPWGPGSASGIKNMYQKLDNGMVVKNPLVGATTWTAACNGVGTHTIEYWATDWAGNESEHVFDKFTILASETLRISKATRSDSAVAIATAANPGWYGVQDIIIVGGDESAAPDSLSAAGLVWAYTRRGVAPPMLTVPSASTPTSVKQAIGAIIAENGRATIHIVGGPASVPEARISDIKAYVKSNRGLTDAQLTAIMPIDRVISTGTRFNTAAAVAVRMKTVRGADMPGFALIANGADAATFYDAAALGPVAAQTGAPILLVNKLGVPTPTSSALKTLGLSGSKTYIAGGTAVVPSAVASKLGTPAANRLAGSDRYRTAIAIVNKSLAANWLSDRNVAVAATLSDALPAGAMVGGQNGVLLLTGAGTSLNSSTRSWLSAHRSNIDACYVAGSSSSIPAATLSTVNAVLAVP